MVVLAILAAALGTARAGDARLGAWGPSPARGLLVNRTVGSRPFDPVDPGRPAVIVVHGLNPFHPLVHFTMGSRYGEAMGRRYGNSVQVFEWDWNAVTTTNLVFGLAANERFCEGQGGLLAGALIGSGIDPGRLSFVGQSSGVIVSVVAARAISARYGRPVGRLTMLDPYHGQHDLIFSRLGATSCALVVEHYWEPGPSGFGGAVDRPGVRSARLASPRRYRGLARPMHSDHLHAVRWHLGSI
jgi:hypothetical protein